MDLLIENYEPLENALGAREFGQTQRPELVVERTPIILSSKPKHSRDGRVTHMDALSICHSYQDLPSPGKPPATFIQVYRRSPPKLGDLLGPRCWYGRPPDSKGSPAPGADFDVDRVRKRSQRTRLRPQRADPNRSDLSSVKPSDRTGLDIGVKKTCRLHVL